MEERHLDFLKAALRIRQLRVESTHSSVIMSGPALAGSIVAIHHTQILAPEPSFRPRRQINQPTALCHYARTRIRRPYFDFK